MLDGWFAQKRAPRLTRRSPERLLTVAAHGASADLEARRTQLADDADGAPPRILSGDADDQLSQLCGNPGSSGAATTLPAPVGAPKQNDASAPPCPARPSRACLASRTNHVPAVTRVGGRGDGAAVDDGPLCRRRADAAALSSRGRDLGGRGPMRRVLRQADGGRAQTSLSWLADTLLSQHRTARIKFFRPTAVDDGPGCRRRADAAALSSRGRDLGGRGPMRRVLRQADRGRAQTSLSWLADTLLSQDRAAPIRFCRPTGGRRARSRASRSRSRGR